MRWWRRFLRGYFGGCVLFALASCATQPKEPIRIEQTAASSKETKKPNVVRVTSSSKTKSSGIGGENLSRQTGHKEQAQGQRKQDSALVKKPDDVPKDEEKISGVEQNQKAEVIQEEEAADDGASVEEGEQQDDGGVAVELWQTDQLVSKGWKFEQVGSILRVGKKDEPSGEKPGLFEDAIIQNRVRSVLIAAGHSEAAESVKVSGGVVVMELDPKDGAERLLTAIEAAFSVVGVQKLEVSPRF